MSEACRAPRDDEEQKISIERRSREDKIPHNGAALRFRTSMFEDGAYEAEVSRDDVVQLVAKAAENNPKIDAKVIAKAYWDLGLAYEYSWEFDKAIECFITANRFHSDDKYAREKIHVERLKEECERIIRQEPKTKDIIINVPFRSTKSLIVTVMFPVWAWIKSPKLRFITS